MKYKSLFLVILVFSLKFSFGQKSFKSAEKAFQQGQFFDALEDYKKANAEAKAEDQKALISFKMGECYRFTGDYKQAEECYANAVKANYTDNKVLLYLADAKKSLGKYDDAMVDYGAYQKAEPSDKEGKDGAKSCELAKKWYTNPTRYKVENVGSINTAEPDFFPSYADKKYNKLYFISSRSGVTGKNINPVNGKTASDIFETQLEKNGSWSTPVPLPELINTKEIEEGGAVTKKADLLFFTRSADLANSQLWISNKVGPVWGEPVKMEFCVETSQYLSPSISDDGMTLLFASNMPGGQGGNDIWMSQYDKGTKKWGAPVNLGPEINTPGDDNYPFIHDDGTLYFSSTGRLGMGGLDIYKAEQKESNQWANVTNMRYPINSGGDDFGIVFEGNKDKGFLSSNREGTKGGVDIWSFMLPPLLFSIEGTVNDCPLKKPIAGISVKLVGSDGSMVETKTDATGNYKFVENASVRCVSANTAYMISIVNGPSMGYLNNETVTKVSTMGVDANKNFKQDFCLSPLPAEKVEEVIENEK